VEVHPDGAALADRHVEGERVALLAHHLVDVGDERVGKASGRAIGGRGVLDVHEGLAEELRCPDPALAGSSSSELSELRRGGRDARRRASHDDLEGFELVLRRSEGGAALCAGGFLGADLLARDGGPDGPGARACGEGPR
jgi:hypothetical protein